MLIMSTILCVDGLADHDRLLHESDDEESYCDLSIHVDNENGPNAFDVIKLMIVPSGPPGEDPEPIGGVGLDLGQAITLRAILDAGIRALIEERREKRTQNKGGSLKGSGAEAGIARVEP